MARLFYIAVAGSSQREAFKLQLKQQSIVNSPHPFNLIIGLDRSDRKADLYTIDPATALRHKQTLNTTPEALHDWLAKLRQQHPTAKVAICLEQPAINLILFLEAYAWITLYPINPITLQKFREAFVTSRAKDDGKDAQYLAELLLTHHQKLKPWQADDSQTRQLQQLIGSSAKEEPTTKPPCARWLSSGNVSSGNVGRRARPTRKKSTRLPCAKMAAPLSGSSIKSNQENLP